MILISNFSRWFRHFLGRALLLLLGILLIRIALKFFGANASALVVGFLYDVTDFFVGPFQLIFPDAFWKSHLVDVVTISAALGYVFIYFVIVAIIRAIFKEW